MEESDTRDFPGDTMQAVVVVAGMESLLWDNSRIRKEFDMQMVL